MASVPRNEPEIERALNRAAFEKALSENKKMLANAMHVIQHPHANNEEREKAFRCALETIFGSGMLYGMDRVNDFAMKMLTP